MGLETHELSSSKLVKPEFLTPVKTLSNWVSVPFATRVLRDRCIDPSWTPSSSLTPAVPQQIESQLIKVR